MNRTSPAALVLPTTLALAGAITGLAAPEASQGWLSSGTPPPAPTASEGSTPRNISIQARDQDLAKVVSVLLTMGFPDGSVRSAIPAQEDRRKVTIRARGPFPVVLEALGAAANLNLVRVGDEVRSQGFYEAPPARPPGDEELESLEKSVQLRASEQDFGKVVQTLATFAGKTAVIPGTEYKRKVSVNLRGNLAQALEALGSMNRMRLWIDGDLIRVSRRCLRRDRSYARPPVGSLGNVSLKANDQDLSKVANVLATFWGGVIPVVPATEAKRRISLDVRDASPLQVVAALEAELPGLDVFLDGPFLRVQPRAQACPPVPTEGPWSHLEDLIYRPIRSDR